MGVYIKGMDIPTEGEYNMTLYVCSDGSAYMDVASFPVGKDKFEAVLVPPGRLIDADALMELYADTDDLQLANMKVPIAVIRQNILDMPIIISASEDSAKAEEDTEPWLCLSCRHYPPSSTDGRPCSQCNPIEVWHSCYDPAEEDE